ncbi:APC family permease [Streptomyces sp. SID3343]|uniref:APC family permease n=1 Tax=Streptomyces sp. SID3343 TaxID=2690260 RepID=UPI00136CC7F7|nr:APC family permease [Streptomyces sp. SID3343]MYV99499.1 amino acid permease [Streptomyces sp. SID3343]
MAVETTPPPPGTSTPTAVTTLDGSGAGPAPLKRSIGVLGGTLLTLSCLTPASSLFVIVPDMFLDLGSGVSLALIVAAVLCVGVAFCYSELGTLVPSAGGEYAMVGTLMGRFMAWLVFVIATIVVMVVPPIIALGTADYLTSIVTIDKMWAGAAVMILATVMGLLDLRANAWVTGIFLALEVIAAGVVAFLGFANSNQPFSTLVKPEIVDAATHTSDPITMGVLIAGMAGALFALQGFSTAVYLAEEMENPRRTVSRTVLWTLGLGGLVLIVPTVAISLGAPSQEALAEGDFLSIVEGWAGHGTATFVGLCVALAIINAGVVMVIQNSRVVYASARDRAWPEPVNRAFGKVNRFGSPWISTLVVGVPGALLCFVTLDTLEDVTGVAVAALYLVVAIAALYARRGVHKSAQAWRMPLWPVIPILLIAFMVYVLTKQEPKALLISGGVLVVAALYWLLYLRPRQDTRWKIQLMADDS